MKHIGQKQTGGPGSFSQGLAGLTLAVLVVLGAGGIVYRTVAPDGWLARLFGRNPAEGVTALLALVALGVLVWLTRGWVNPGMRHRLSGILVFSFAAAGLLQVVEFLLDASP